MKSGDSPPPDWTDMVFSYYKPGSKKEEQNCFGIQDVAIILRYDLGKGVGPSTIVVLYTPFFTAICVDNFDNIDWHTAQFIKRVYVGCVLNTETKTHYGLQVKVETKLMVGKKIDFAFFALNRPKQMTMFEQICKTVANGYWRHVQ